MSIGEAIQEILMTWSEDVYLGYGNRVLYFSHAGHWHVTSKLNRGIQRVIYDGEDFQQARLCFLGLKDPLKASANIAG